MKALFLFFVVLLAVIVMALLPNVVAMFALLSGISKAFGG